MCGILGEVGKEVHKPLFAKALKSLTNRGPDFGDQRTFEKDDYSVLLGHRRLSILDLSDEAAQPMVREHLTIVYNGEVFNYSELRTELERKGHQFRTSSDTEVILVAWLEWGEECLHKFNGMWAFALWDDKEETLILCRDRYGIKPLYFGLIEGSFLFGSTIESVRKLSTSPLSYNTEVLRTIANGSFTWHGDENTFYGPIKILKSGTLLQFKPADASVHKRTWYTLKRREVPASLEEQARELRELIFDACRIRMRSDVPIATCLSGGVDSTSISACLHQMEREKTFSNFSHKAFTAAFPNSAIDESESARSFADSVGLKFNLVELNAPSAGELETHMAACDGPMHALAFYPIAKLYSKIAETGIKVTLDGQGPDEMLGGYHSVIPALRGAMRNWSRARVNEVVRIYGEQKSLEGSDFRLWRDNLIKTVGRDELKNIIRKLVGRKIILSNDFHPFSDDAFDEHLYRQFFIAPLPGILQQYDRCSMASSVECRMPFMDYRIVEFVFSLPIASKVGDGYTKYVLRRAMSGISPEHILWNKSKIGFNAPIVEWYKGPLKEWVGDQMSSKSFLESDYFDGKSIADDYWTFVKEDLKDWNRAWRYWGALHVNWWKGRKDR